MQDEGHPIDIEETVDQTSGEAIEEPVMVDRPELTQPPSRGRQVDVTSPEWDGPQTGTINHVHDAESGLVDITVFPSFGSDGRGGDTPLLVRKTSVQHASQNDTYYWDYPARV